MRGLILFVAFIPMIIFADETTLIIPPFKHSWGIHKGTEKELKLYLGPNAKFDNTQGLAVTRLKVWDDPSNEADDDEVTVYGVNSGAGEIIYNSSMYSLAVYRNEKAGGFKNPHGIAVSSDGLVYVADTGNKRVVKLQNDGKNLSFISNVGFGVLGSPWGVALDSQGNLYVSDNEKNKIFMFSRDDKYLGEIPMKLFGPTAIAVVDQNEPWSYYQENLIAVVDSFGQRISLYNFIGEILGSVNMRSIGFGNANLQYLAFDYYNNLYATDIVNSKIHKFDNRLNYLTSFGHENQFDEPRGIAIYRKYGQVFVGEKASAQYFWIGTDIKDVIIREQGKFLEFSFILTETSYLTVELERKGKKIPLKSKEKTRCGNVRIRVQSDFLKKGDYYLVIKAEPTYSSYGVFNKTIRKGFVVGR